MDATDAGAKGDAAGESLDPFAFFAGFVSRVAGLGGDVPSHDPTYAFHTAYVPAARGAAEFTVAFDGLVATRGTLAVRVHMLPIDRSAHARLVNSERVTLPRLIRQGGRLTIGFESYRGMSYAVVGLIADDTDAAAAGLAVTLDRPYDAAADDGEDVAVRTTSGSETLRATAQMVSALVPTLAAPVSQIYTPAQAAEAPFARWRTRLCAADVADRALWEHVYLLEILQRYGLLEPGARGLGVDVGDGPVPAMLAAMGVDIVVTGADPGSADGVLDALRRPALCEAATFDSHIAFREADPRAIPADVTDFDFAWSRVAGGLESPTARLRFVEDMMSYVAVGGVVIQLFDFLLPADALPDNAAPALLRKGEAERMALQLISRGHEVAQVRTEGRAGRSRRARDGKGPTGMVTSFGLVARRGAPR